MKVSLVILAIIVGQLCWAEESTTPRAKNVTAPGRYDSHRGGNRHRGGHGEDYGRKKHEYRAPVIDDYICDLEATILVVSSKHHVKEEKSYSEKPTYGSGNNNYAPSGYGTTPQQGYGNQGGYGNNNNNYSPPQQGYENQGYGSSQSYGGGQGYEEKTKRHEYATPEALRLKCSHIAIHSEHDCHTCCQLSARRYHSVSKHDIFGFIVDASELKHDEKGYVRSKRSTNQQASPPAPAPSQNYNSVPASAPVYENYSPAPQPEYPVAPEYSAQTPEYSSDSNYPAAKGSYAASSHDYYTPPKNARCVCCAPKRHDHHRHHDRYDRSDSREY